MTALRPTLRQPDITRSRLLECAFNEILQRGFRSASLDSILIKAGVTKGALYHHFENKAALGYAVVDEVIQPFMQSYWLPLVEAEDPIACSIAGIKKRRDKLRAQLLTYGCPYNNLAQEMSPIDEGFRARLQAIIDEWWQTLSAALERGKASGKVRMDVNAPAAAIFIISSLEGVIGMGKASQNSALFEQGLRGLVEYLERLRPA